MPKNQSAKKIGTLTFFWHLDFLVGPTEILVGLPENPVGRFWHFELFGTLTFWHFDFLVAL